MFAPLALLAALALAQAAPSGQPSSPSAPESGPAPRSGSRGTDEGPPARADPLDERRDALASEMVRLGAALRREIEAGDVEAILVRVPPEGLRCSGRVVPRQKVARDLRAPGTWLHGVLLGGPGYAPPPGVASSLRALFQGAARVAVLVAFREDPRAGPAGLPCLDFRAREVGTPGAPLCFEARGGRWWFTESLYPCR